MPTEANLMIVSFPTSMPASEARAHVIPDAMVESPPTWSLQTLNLGPARSSPDYESHLARTVGSSYDWSDELRFARGDGRLCSVVLKTPEAGETDAVFCSSDLLALGVATEARVRGIAIPKALAVVGFGDLEFARDLAPALTTVHIKGAAIGQQAAQFIVDRAEGRPVDPRIVDIGFSIIEREST